MRYSQPYEKSLAVQSANAQKNCFQDRASNLNHRVHQQNDHVAVNTREHARLTHTTPAHTNRHKAGAHHSKRTNRAVSASPPIYDEGDEDDDGNADSRDDHHQPASGEVNSAVRNGPATEERFAGGDEGADCSKYEGNGSVVGATPGAEDGHSGELRGGRNGYRRSPTRSHYGGVSSPGGIGGGGVIAAAGAPTAAGVVNPPIAVLGRPNYVDFPGLEDTHFGEGVAEGGVTLACAVLRDHFEKKEVLKARVNFLLYQVGRVSYLVEMETTEGCMDVGKAASYRHFGPLSAFYNSVKWRSCSFRGHCMFTSLGVRIRRTGSAFVDTAQCRFMGWPSAHLSLPVDCEHCSCCSECSAPSQFFAATLCMKARPLFGFVSFCCAAPPLLHRLSC